ncbi:MARVEL-like domain-containing protein [Mangrovimonas sp. AS18]|nr:CASP domain-containing protein [Mangrovimonas futianensis]MCF1423286.1 MARVEL-like domain-containing protein [Mangrovimonas futianensis]
MLKLLDCSLRIFAIPLSVATIWLTVTNQQDNTSYGKLEFSNLTGLK